MEMPQGGANGEAPGGLESPLSPPLSPATAAAAALANARWNPTKEQVTMLEGLYEHGLRTPSAEQIQHITSRLREHGPIEAKNVFYWFQNHKARQRQKQRQDSFAYFNRMMRRAPPLPVIARPPVPSFPPMMTMAPPPPAVCNNGGGGTHVMYRTPYYMPAPPPQASAANAAGYYSVQQAAHHMAAMYPRMEIAAHGKHMNPASMHQPPAPYGTSDPVHVPPASGTSNPLHVPPANGVEAGDHVSRSRQTLELFPLRPTFLLPDTARDFSILSSSSASFSGGESESLAESPNSSAEALPFYDFFGLQSADR